MPFWKRLPRLAALFTFAPVLFLLGCQYKLIYFPRHYRAEHEGMLRAAKGEKVSFSTSLGSQAAFYIPPRVPAAGLPQTLWVCFAGNSSLALEWLPFTQRWDGHFAYLLVDYPSYGECKGRPTPGRIRESGKAAVEALACQLHTTVAELQPRMAVLGHSMGSAAALMTAADLDIRHGVLLSPFTTMTEMARKLLGWPVCHLNRHRFNNRKTLNQVAARDGARFVIFHGAEDELIPVRMGRELAAEHPEVVTFREVPGGHHNDLLMLCAPEIGRAMVEVAGKPVR